MAVETASLMMENVNLFFSNPNNKDSALEAAALIATRKNVLEAELFQMSKDLTDRQSAFAHPFLTAGTRS